MPTNRIHYGWVVVIAGAIMLSTCSLALFTFGVFLRPLSLQFGWERGPISLAVSITFLVAGVTGLLTGKICDRYGPRILVTLGGIIMGAGYLLMAHATTLIQVYIFWGLFLGIAQSCLALPILSTIPRWFVHRRGIAVSIPFAGFGIGSIVSPILAQLLLSAYGWQNAITVLGIIALVINIPLSQLTRKDPAEMRLKPYGESVNPEVNRIGNPDKEHSLTEAMRTLPFWIFGTLDFLWLFCQQTITIHIVSHAIDKGIADLVAAGILSILGSVTVAGMLSIGFIADKLGARRSLSMCLIIGTLALVWFSFAGGIWAFYIFAFVFGLAVGGTKPLDMLVSAELFGVKSMGIILGAILLFGTMGGAIGPAFAGYTYDLTGSYNVTLIALVVISTIATVLGLVLLKYKSKPIQNELNIQ
jgi:OFA family oxalate/formate antiporter-like MFS transporter